MASKKKIKEWKGAGYDYASDQLADHKVGTPIDKRTIQRIEGSAMDLMGGNDEAASYAVDGMREVFKKKQTF